MPIFSSYYTMRQLDIDKMPVSTLLFLISEPCWRVSE
jgi:hypothetical protein